MKLIIAGSRTIHDQVSENYRALIRALDKYRIQDVTEVVSGRAVGPDRLGEKWALVNNIKIKEMPADWNTHKKAAGPIRNRKMAEYADAALILWDGKSKGTKNMIDEMKRLGKPYYLELVEVPEDELKPQPKGILKHLH